MKVSLAIAILTGSIFISGCQQEQKTGVSQTSTQITSIASAPAQYLSSAGKAMQSMVKTVDTASLNNTVQFFNVQEGRFPKDLNELVEKKYLGHLPTPPFGFKLQYEPKDGTVTVIKE